jgi:hypothetical protein
MNGPSIKPIAVRRKAVPEPHIIIKGSFLPEEDEMITSFAMECPQRPWLQIATVIPHHTLKQCRERWSNHLDPAVKKDPWAEEEDVMIFQLSEQIGRKWAEIARSLPGRSDNAIKNRYNSSIVHRIRDDVTGARILAPSEARPYHQKTQVRKPSRAALERQPLAFVQPPTNDNEIPIPDEDLEFPAPDDGDLPFLEPEDFAFWNPEP